MPVIETRIDPKSREFQENQEHMEKLVADLREALRLAREDRSKKARARLAEQNKLPVQERLDLLLDRGTPFLEIAPLAARGMYDGRVHGAGAITGIGVVEGREVMVTASDPMIKGGSIYPMGVKKSLRAQTVAMENRLPMVNLIDSGGAFLPLQSEIFPDADDGGRIFYHQAVMSKMGIAQITAVMGLCTAGAAYIPAMSDYVVHVNKTGAIFLGGPPLVKAATGEEVTADELGGAKVHCTMSGVSDFFANDDAHAIDIVRSIVRKLPQAEKARLKTEPARPPLYDPKEIYGIVPKNIRHQYEVREVIARMVDGSELLEFKELYGRTLVCGWAHIHGYPVGILANNGVLFSDSSLKAAHFIQITDKEKIPLLFLQNISGYIVGKDYERGGITKDGQKMVEAVSTATVPKFTVIMGASFGAGNYGMCGRAYGPRLLWMWPNSKIGVMGGEQAANVLLTVKMRQLEKKGHKMSPAEQEAFKAPVIEKYEQEASAYYSTAHLWDDGILDPLDTRSALALGIAMSLNAPIPDQKYGVFRM
jgi:acetyl-CoA carboxylase carboxyltransferase component